MRRGINPFAIIVLFVTTVIAFIMATTVKNVLPQQIEQWSGLIFWLVLIIVGGGSALIVGKFMNRR